jgi:hypothetical protein
MSIAEELVRKLSLYVLLIIGAACSRAVSQFPSVTFLAPYSRSRSLDAGTPDQVDLRRIPSKDRHYFSAPYKLSVLGREFSKLDYIATNNSISNLKCNGMTNDTAALTALLAALGSVQASIVFPSHCLLSTVSIPANVTLDATSDGGIMVATGHKVTVLGPIIPRLQQIFFNALPGEGTIDFTGGTALERVYPEWWGASPKASASINTPAIQSAIWGAFGCGPVACRTNGSGLNQYNRELHFTGMYNINAELRWYHILSFLVTGEGKLNSGINQTATDARIIDGQSVAYGTFSNLQFSAKAPQDANHPLIDIDYEGSQGNDIRPQFVTFEDVGWSGDSIAAVGLLLAKSGGGAQGSNVVCYNCFGKGFSQAVWQIGTSRRYAQNALDNGWYGGDIQNAPQFGIAVYGGNVIVKDATFEDGILNQTGYDVYCVAPQQPCDMENVRSESAKLMAGDFSEIRNSYTIFQAYVWDSSSGLGGKSATRGQLVSGSSIAGDGKYYKITAPGTWGGLNSTAATSGSSTTLVCSGCKWTINVFSGMRAAIIAGSGVGYYGIVSSNTATTITVAGWITQFPLLYLETSSLASLPPDNTSAFIVEPNWGTQTICGSVTFAPVVFNAIDGTAPSTPAHNVVLDNVTVAAGQINAIGILNHVGVTRADWDAVVSPLYATRGIIVDQYNEILARLPCAGCQWKDGSLLNWSFPNSGGYSGYSQYQLGSLPVVWGITGQKGQPANDVWIGGRSDPNSSNDPTRAILEYGGLLGPPTPIGANQNAGAAGVSCGLSTGSGTPGVCNWYVGARGLPGSRVNRSSIGMTLSTGGLRLGVHLNQNATGNYGGSCTMSSNTSCTFSLDVGYTNPVCIATVQSVSVVAGACSVSGNTVTITAASSNSSTWGALVFGNPN